MVGGLSIDVGLPANVGIAAYIDDVIDIANEQIAVREPPATPMFDDTDGKWTLARLGGDPIDPHRSLSEAGIYDGDLLMIREVGRPVSPLLFDDVDDALDGEPSAVRGWLAANAAALTCFGVGLAATVTLAAIAADAGPAISWCPPRCSALGRARRGVRLRDGLPAVDAATRSAWVAAVAMPLVFAGSLYIVPDGFGATSLPMAFALTALSSLLVLLISGAGRALHTGVIAACAFGGAAATAMLLWQPPLRTVGALLATVAVIVVYLAPRVTILLSKLPIPRVPTAGEPLDDIETQGGTTVEGVNAVGKQIIPTEEGLIQTGPAGQRVPHRDPRRRGAGCGRRQLPGRRCQQWILLAGHGFRRSGGDRAVPARAQPPRFGAVGDPHRQRAGDRDRRHRQDGGQPRGLADPRHGDARRADGARRRLRAGRASRWSSRR